MHRRLLFGSLPDPHDTDFIVLELYLVAGIGFDRINFWVWRLHFTCNVFACNLEVTDKLGKDPKSAALTAELRARGMQCTQFQL
jgi:hypothetical protein